MAQLSSTELHQIKNASAILIRIRVQRTQIAWAESQSLPGGPRSASLENEPDSGVGDGTLEGNRELARKWRLFCYLAEFRYEE